MTMYEVEGVVITWLLTHQKTESREILEPTSLLIPNALLTIPVKPQMAFAAKRKGTSCENFLQKWKGSLQYSNRFWKQWKQVI